MEGLTGAANGWLRRGLNRRFHQPNQADLGEGITEHHITHLATLQVVGDVFGAIGIVLRRLEGPPFRFLLNGSPC